MIYCIMIISHSFWQVVVAGEIEFVWNQNEYVETVPITCQSEARSLSAPNKEQAPFMQR